MAYAEGRIELPTDFGSKARVDSFRNAPSFRTVERDVFKDVKHIPKPYNAETIAKFLGWMSGRGTIRVHQDGGQWLVTCAGPDGVEIDACIAPRDSLDEALEAIGTVWGSACWDLCWT